MQTQKVPPVFETNVTSNTTIVADQEAFFADAATPTHPPIGGFRLRSRGIINESGAAKIVRPVADAVAAVAPTAGRPTELLNSSVGSLETARSHCWEEDLRVSEARSEVATAKASAEEQRRLANELPAKLDAEIRDVRDRAAETRRTDPRDTDLELAAESARGGIARADRAAHSAASEARRCQERLEVALRDVRDSEAELDRARRQGYDDERVAHLSERLAEHQREAGRAEEAHAVSERARADADAALQQAHTEAGRASRAAEDARQRNRQRLEQDASRLEREAKGLVASRQSKLNEARDRLKRAEEELTGAQARCNSRIEDACLARRESTRRAKRLNDLQAIQDIAMSGSKLQRGLTSACNEVKSSCRSLAASAGGLAALASGKSAKTSNAAHAQDSDVVEFQRSLRALLRDRRRGYQRIWLIALPFALLTYFGVNVVLPDEATGWGVAVFLVPFALHAVH